MGCVYIYTHHIYIVLICMYIQMPSYRGHEAHFCQGLLLKCLSTQLPTCSQVLLRLHCPDAYCLCYSVILMRIYGPGLAVALPKQL